MSRTTVPVPVIEKDCYDWAARHKAKLAEAARDHKVLFIGDSLTHFWSPEDGVGYGADVWKKYYGGQSVMNLGYGYDRTQNVLWRLASGEADHQNPSVVVLCIGTNQFSCSSRYSGDSPEEAWEGILAVVTALRDRFPNAEILLMHLFPRGGKEDSIRAVNRMMDQAVLPEKVRVLSLDDRFRNPDGSIRTELYRSDCCHLNRDGYVLWAEALKKYLPFPEPGKESGKNE